MVQARQMPQIKMSIMKKIHIATAALVITFLVAAIAILVLVFTVWNKSFLLVVTTQGTVKGVWSKDTEYAMYLGIPYANVDPDNPFGDARPGPVFDQIFHADEEGPLCPQKDAFSADIVGAFECLQVNIYVPKSTTVSDLRPVMVWIHGGEFQSGTAGRLLYGPEHLIEKGIILVTLSYRVGVYGFLCLDTPDVPGNAGLKDQRRALRWIRDNISAFGGDNTSITVAGEGAGGISIELHMISPGSHDLFDRVILQSGVALVEQAIVRSRPTALIEIAFSLGYEVNSVEEAFHIMKSIDPYDLIAAVESLGIAFKPCVEQKFDGVENFIINYPDIILASGDYKSAQMMVGYNTDGQSAKHHAYMKDPLYIPQQNNAFIHRVSELFNLTENTLYSLTKSVREFYLGTQTLNNQSVQALIDFDSDIRVLHPTERSVSYHLKNSEHEIYQYVFAYNGGINFMKQFLNVTDGGAANADELAYLFTQPFTPRDLCDEDRLTVERMTTIWTNFVKYGDPTPQHVHSIPIRWPSVSSDREYLLIDTNLTIHRKPFHRRVAFWDTVFEIYGEHFIMV